MDIARLPPLQALIRQHRSDPAPSAQERAVLENFTMEERVDNARLQVYADAVGVETWALFDQLHSAHGQRYLQKRIELDKSETEVPDTFDSALNAGNFWNQIEGNLALYRIEKVSFALEGIGIDEAEFKESIDAMTGRGTRRTKGDAAVTLARVCNEWNSGRDLRPLFATTEPEIETLLADHGADWANDLRDHLGLGHLNE